MLDKHNIIPLHLGELLNDIRSIKLSPQKRAWINRLRIGFESNGAIPNDEKFKLFAVAKRYNRQFKELYAARERARHSNSLKKAGISRDDAHEVVERRVAEEEATASDVGF